jgi:hypothetical protein
MELKPAATGHKLLCLKYLQVPMLPTNITSMISASLTDNHVRKVIKVLERLKYNRFTVNPRKCAWAVHKAGWLSHYLPPITYKPD